MRPQPAAAPAPLPRPTTPDQLSPFATTYAEITEIRANEPERIAHLLRSRQRRPLLSDDGRLMIIAADHPARGALSAAGRPDAMHDRRDLLDRLRTALSRPGVDGVLATADVAEDLLLLGALEGKIVLTSLNRGGIAGSVFELDDRLTGYDIRGTVEAAFDGAKMLLRIDPDDPGTVRTLELAGRLVTEAARARLVAMIEPFMCRRVDGAVRNDLTPEAVITSIHIAQGLGASSAYTWLKLPVVADMERVVAATTLPCVLLGGDPGTDRDEMFADWQRALALPAVRGLMVGRTLLYPSDDDVATAVDTAVSLLR